MLYLPKRSSFIVLRKPIYSALFCKHLCVDDSWTIDLYV